MTATIHQQATHLLDTPRGVRSNKGEIDNQYIGWLRPTSKDTSIEEMRQILDEDGYLFVKGLLPRDDVVNMRRQ